MSIVATKQAVEWGGKEPFRYGFLDLSGSGAGPFLPLVNLADSSGTPLDPATSEGQANAATLLGQIRDAVKAQRSETLWTDSSGSYFIRVDNGATLSWYTPTGAASAAPGAGIKPAGGSGGGAPAVDRSAFVANQAGAGFSNGDLVDHFLTADASTGAPLGNFWLNITQGTTIAAPAAAALSSPAPTLPSGAATDATLQAIKALLGKGQQNAAGSLPVVLSSDGPFTTNFGAPSDVAAANDAATSSFVGLFRRSLGYLGTLASTVSGGVLAVLTSPLEVSGALAAINDAVTVSAAGRNTAVFVVPAGSWSGALVVEGSANGAGDFADAIALSTIPYGGGAAQSTITAGGIYEVTATGLKTVRLRASTAITGGPITCTARTAIGNKSLRVGAPAANPLPVYDLSLGTVASVTLPGSAIQIGGVDSSGNFNPLFSQSNPGFTSLTGSLTITNAPNVYTCASAFNGTTASTGSNPAVANQVYPEGVVALAALPTLVTGTIYSGFQTLDGLRLTTPVPSSNPAFAPTRTTQPASSGYVAKATPGNLVFLQATDLVAAGTSASVWLIVYDATAVPSSGASLTAASIAYAKLMTAPSAANGAVLPAELPVGLVIGCTNGITILFSSTNPDIAAPVYTPVSCTSRAFWK